MYDVWLLIVYRMDFPVKTGDWFGDLSNNIKHTLLSFGNNVDIPECTSNLVYVFNSIDDILICSNVPRI